MPVPLPGSFPEGTLGILGASAALSGLAADGALAGLAGAIWLTGGLSPVSPPPPHAVSATLAAISTASSERSDKRRFIAAPPLSRRQARVAARTPGPRTRPDVQTIRSATRHRARSSALCRAQRAVRPRRSSESICRAAPAYPAALALAM